jgi:hypothetical protein
MDWKSLKKKEIASLLGMRDVLLVQTVKAKERIACREGELVG